MEVERVEGAAPPGPGPRQVSAGASTESYRLRRLCTFVLGRVSDLASEGFQFVRLLGCPRLVFVMTKKCAKIHSVTASPNFFFLERSSSCFPCMSSSG